jgi:hypothetical protein
MERGPFRRPGAAVAEAPEPAPYLLAADISNYSGYLSSDQVVALAEAGVEHVIVRISLEDAARRAITSQQLKTLRAHGIPVSGYFFPCYDTPPSQFMPAVLALAGEVSSLWVDVEPPDLPDPYTIASWIWAASAVCPIDLGIYSAKWAWPAGLDMSNYPLWEAAYRPFTGLEVNYAGWTRAAGIQYEGSTTVGGVLCDLSWFEASVL